MQRMMTGLIAAICALTCISCEVGGPDEYIVRATIVQYNGKFHISSDVQLARGTISNNVSTATVTVAGNELAWSDLGLDYSKTSTWNPDHVDAGGTVDLSIVHGTATITGSVTVPSRIIDFTSGTLVNHSVNTPLTVTWNGDPVPYATAPEFVILEIMVNEPGAVTHEIYLVPLAAGTFEFPASFFPTPGRTIYLWAGTANETVPTGTDVDTAASFLRLRQVETQLAGNTL